MFWYVISLSHLKRKHSKKLTVKGGCSFFFSGVEMSQVVFFRPSILPPSPKHSIPSRFPGLGNSRLANPIRKPVATQRFGIFTLQFPKWGFSMIHFDECIFWVGDETENWKPTKHLKPRSLEVREVSIGRTVHVPNLGLFFHGGPGQMRFKAGIQWNFWRFWLAVWFKIQQKH